LVRMKQLFSLLFLANGLALLGLSRCEGKTFGCP
jgi:hypothetical protein